MIFDTSDAIKSMLEHLQSDGYIGVNGSTSQVDRIMRLLHESLGDDSGMRTSWHLPHDETELQLAYNPTRLDYHLAREVVYNECKRKLRQRR